MPGVVARIDASTPLGYLAEPGGSPRRPLG
jgi:hypothetical protein